jgi:hypothetical protein
VSFYQDNSAKQAGAKVPEPLDFEERKVCWIRDSFHIRDPEALVRRKRPSLIRRPRSLSIAGDEDVRQPNEDDASAELWNRASKTSPSYAGQMGTGSYFLSLADDLNSATLKRLGPETASPANRELEDDLSALVVIDWDDTLFPTSWSNRAFPQSETEYRESVRGAIALLRTARSLGDVVIVTLAREGWVDECLVRAADPDLSR